MLSSTACRGWSGVSTDAPWADRQFERILRLFVNHDVEFLVIGGRAEQLLGGSRLTYDTDLTHRRTPENLERLAAALRELDVTLRDAPAGLVFPVDAASLGLGNNFTFNSKAGALDLLAHVEPIGGYERLIERSERVNLDGLMVQHIGLDDLITVKRYLGRPQDRAALLQLEAIRTERGSRADR